MLCCGVLCRQSATLCQATDMLSARRKHNRCCSGNTCLWLQIIKLLKEWWAHGSTIGNHKHPPDDEAQLCRMRKQRVEVGQESAVVAGSPGQRLG